MDKITLPAATGIYKVGTCTFSMVDENRFEQLGTNPGTCKRKVFARLYYPVLPENTEGMPDAIVMSDAKLAALSKMYHFPIKDRPESGCFLNARPAEGKFPLIIFSHGLGSYAESNNLMCKDLCSHGYNVLAIGHAYEAVLNEYDDGTSDPIEKNATTKVYSPYLPAVINLLKLMGDKKSDDRTLRDKMFALEDKYCAFLIARLDDRVKDVALVTDEALKRFGDRIDLEHGIGIMGHSLGGATAYYICQTDDRFTAGLNLDGLIINRSAGLGMHKPFYQVSCEDSVNTQTQVALDTDAPIYWTVFRNMRHQGFSDMKFFAPIAAVTGKMPPLTMHETLCKIQLSFFDRYIKGGTGEVWIPSGDSFIRRT